VPNSGCLSHRLRIAGIAPSLWSEASNPDASFVSDEPWESHSNALPPKALAYPVGWDVINDS